MENTIIKKHEKKTKKIKRGNSLERSQERAFYTIIMPFVIFLLLVKGYPLIWGVYVSLTNFTGFNLNNLSFVGFDNYKRVLIDNEAIPSILRVLRIGMIAVPVKFVICITLSLILSNAFKGVSLFRTIFYIPSVIPPVAIALMWKGMYSLDGGLFNAIREILGFEAVNWLGYNYVRTALIIMMLWTSGSSVLINIAAIKGIPDDLFEAADIEGARALTKIFKITLPMISNMLYMEIVTSIIYVLQLFAQPVLLAGATGTGLTSVPIKPVYTYLVHIYQQVFVNMRFGYGMAMVWVMFIIIMSITFVLDKTKKYWVYNEVD